ncbi:MAG: T9SS type A sorting domain-containing protein [Bacteroidetes bacterium]|nr:T9SS type A sorting domain-containing protein [Bacteroidota bacterium]
MKKFLFFCSFLFGTSVSLFAQWNPLSVGSTQELYGIQYNSPPLIYVTGVDGLIKSTDNGSTWNTFPLLDVGGSPILASILYDVHFFDAFTGVATGLMVSGNNEVILRTTNGGVNWSTVSLYGGGAWPRNLNDINFPSATNGFAVGTNGRILRTFNAGATWSSSPSGTTQALTSVCFTSTSTGFAVGNNIILKTINGGTSWTQTSIASTSFKSVYFPTVTTGYAVADNSKIYKTTNSGASWSLVPVYGTYSFTDVFFTAQDTGYATSGNVVLKTNNGGTLWEEQIVSSAVVHNGIAFQNSTDGILVGKNGNAYKTTNSGGVSGPIASFSTSTSTFCKDSLFSFINNGPVGYSYQWFFNGVLFSSAYNPSFSFTNGGQTDTISLVAFNGSLYDTVYQYPYVQPALNFTMSTAVVNDSICPGTSATLQVASSIVGVTYKLRNGTTQIGVTQNGTGGTLSFSTGTVASTTTFNILGTKTNVCGTYQQVNYDTVYVIPNNNLLPVSATSTIVCKNSSTTITVGSSNVGTMYQLKVGAVNIGPALMGNGSTISFPSGNLLSTTTFSIQATSYLGCVSLLTNTITIAVEVPLAYFTVGSYNVGIGELVNCFNTSVNPGGTYSWDFGVGASIPSSTLMSPVAFSYSSLGIKVIKLIAVGPNGCLDTAQINVNVINYDTTGSCYISQMNCIPSMPVQLHAVENDSAGNFYCFGDYYGGNLNLFSPNNTDTIKLLPGDNIFVSKSNKFGVLQWALNSSGAGTAAAKAIHVDGQGNVFVLGYTQWGPASFNSIDNSTVVAVPVDNKFLCKYDKNGILKFVKYFNLVFSERVGYSVKTDSSGNIYLSAQRSFYKLDPGGNILWSKTLDYYGDATVDPNGDSYIVSENGLVVQKFNPMGVLIWQTPFIQVAPPASYPKVWSKILKKDEAGNIYVFGNFQQNFIFNGDTLYNANPVSGPVQYDVFIAKFSPGGVPLGILQGEASFNSYISGAAVKNGHAYLLGSARPGLGDTISFAGIPALSTATISSVYSNLFLLQTDTLLRPQHLVKLVGDMLGDDDFNDALSIDSNENIYISSTYSYDFTLAQTFVGLGGGCCNPGAFAAKLDTNCIFVDYTNVWPGDANNDSVANNFDLLPIGLHYSQTGSPRSTISNSWQAYPSAEWGTTQSNGSDINHADCNGDGIINANDTLAVNLNFASIHAFAPEPSNDARLLSPPMYFSTTSSSYLPGDWVNVDVMLGTSALPVENLYGIAFNINYDASMVQPGTESLNYPASWFASPGLDGIKLSKIVPLANTAYGAETRIDHVNTDGFGKIATFRFQALSTISATTPMYFSYSGYTANDSAGANVLLSLETDTIYIVPLATALNDTENINGIDVYPNPYSGSTNIYYSLVRNSNVAIEIYNTIGQKIETIVDGKQSAGEYKYTFSAKENGYDAGIYFVKFMIDGKTTMKRIIEVK